MFYFLHFFSEHLSVLNLFRYITFRVAAASVSAFLICIILGPQLIAWLRKVKVVANQKREHAESIHQFYEHKKEVPTMGGLLILVSVLVSTLLWADLQNKFIWILFISTLCFGMVGFLDDWLKLRFENTKGLESTLKLFGQILIGSVIGWVLYVDPRFTEFLYFPFIKYPLIDLAIFFIPFVVLVLVGTSNSLNLTDGLDGLAIGCSLFTTTAFSVIAYIVGRYDYSSYLQIAHIPGAAEITIFCGALVGASAGFLWYNSYPAEVMMGDTGSLSLGGAIGTIAVLLKKELVLVVVGGVFVWEALSVLIQVGSFRLTGKRVFLMSPFHHHLQRMGWPESKIVIRLWIISFVLAILGLGTLKVQ